MLSFALFISLIGGLNIWLALTILHAVLTGATCIRNQTFRREEEPTAFWIAIGCRAAAALLSYSFLVNMISAVLRHRM
jgi:hypothetical protein